MDPLDQLKSALVYFLQCWTWSQMELEHPKVGLPWRTDRPERVSSKPKYCEWRIQSLTEDELLDLARRCLALHLPAHGEMALQDAVWNVEADGRQALTSVSRKALAKWLERRILDASSKPAEFVGRFGALRGDEKNYDWKSAAYAADGSLLVEPAFWSNATGRLAKALEDRPVRMSDLLKAFGFDQWPDRRVFQMLEHLTHPDVRQGPEQQQWVDGLNEILAADGFKLHEHDRLSGHPTYRVGPVRARFHSRPKNLIFGSSGPKPEIGFVSAVDNEIELLSNPGNAFIYDEPIEPDLGLTWLTLLRWYAQDRPVDKPLRIELGNRLMSAAGSPVEQALFRQYFEIFGRQLGDRLPALLPQVVYHHDPASLRQLKARGLERRYHNHRMDFMLLLPGNVRIILEVDGQQHYSEPPKRVVPLANGEALASPAKYAETMRSDRELRLAGYEVYRFGGAELQNDNATETVKTFFTELFQRHGVK